MVIPVALVLPVPAKAADAGSLEGKLCPVGGAPVMEKVAATRIKSINFS